MRVLLISENVGKTATGIVAQRLIKGLSNKVKLFILTDDNNNSHKQGDNEFYYSKIHHYNPFLVLVSFLLFKKNIFESKWGNEYIGVMPSFDLVVSCVSYGHYAALTTANKICKAQKTRHVTYFVDAIPTPKEYAGNNWYLMLMRNPLKKFLIKQTKKVSIIYSTCLEMSTYQKSIICNKEVVYDELLNPSPYNHLINLPKSEKEIFVFAGQVYYPRTPKFVLDAFDSLLLEYPNAELHFIGTKYLQPFLSDYNENTLRKIKICEFIEDIENVYSKACGLIDIGCYVEKDIFMSSKLSGYISFNRPIVCESSNYSAPRRIFKEDPSVFLCGHNSSQILEAMRQCIIKKDDFDYSKREQIISQFSIESIVRKVLDSNQNI